MESTRVQGNAPPDGSPAPAAPSAARPAGGSTVPAAGTAADAVRGRARVRRARGRVVRVLRDRWDVLAVISLGGAVGSLARWGLTLAWPPHPGRFPWATLSANVTGCLLIGVLMVFVLDVWPPSRYLRPFLGVGVLGGYTTFSTAMLDVRAELEVGHQAAAGAYLGGSLAAGLVAVWFGMVGARLAVVGARRLRAARTRRPGDGGHRAGAGAVGPDGGPGTGPRNGPRSRR